MTFSESCGAVDFSPQSSEMYCEKLNSKAVWHAVKELVTVNIMNF